MSVTKLRVDFNGLSEGPFADDDGFSWQNTTAVGRNANKGVDNGAEHVVHGSNEAFFYDNAAFHGDVSHSFTLRHLIGAAALVDHVTAVFHAFQLNYEVGSQTVNFTSTAELVRFDKHFQNIDKVTVTIASGDPIAVDNIVMDIATSRTEPHHATPPDFIA